MAKRKPAGKRPLANKGKSTGDRIGLRRVDAKTCELLHPRGVRDGPTTSPKCRRCWPPGKPTSRLTTPLAPGRLPSVHRSPPVAGRDRPGRRRPGVSPKPFRLCLATGARCLAEVGSSRFVAVRSAGKPGFSGSRQGACLVPVASRQARSGPPSDRTDAYLDGRTLRGAQSRVGPRQAAEC